MRSAEHTNLRVTRKHFVKQETKYLQLRNVVSVWRYRKEYQNLLKVFDDAKNFRIFGGDI